MKDWALFFPKLCAINSTPTSITSVPWLNTFKISTHQTVLKFKNHSYWVAVLTFKPGVTIFHYLMQTVGPSHALLYFLTIFSRYLRMRILTCHLHFSSWWQQLCFPEYMTSSEQISYYKRKAKEMKSCLLETE